MEQALEGTEVVIAYQPLAGEPEYPHAPMLEKYLEHIVLLPQGRREDPFIFAEHISKKFEDKQVAILIPGTHFDVSGTRHGRGGGWYDRFLARVPRTWLRIGVAYQTQISDTPLTRESWDKPMDWLLIEQEGGWALHKADSV